MRIVTISGASKVPFNLDGYIMHSSSSLEVIHLCLQPGQEILQHTNPFDVVVSLINGDVTLHQDDNKIQLTLYDTVELEKNLSRGFSNHGNKEARLLILKKF